MWENREYCPKIYFKRKQKGLFSSSFFFIFSPGRRQLVNTDSCSDNMLSYGVRNSIAAYLSFSENPQPAQMRKDRSKKSKSVYAIPGGDLRNTDYENDFWRLHRDSKDCISFRWRAADVLTLAMGCTDTWAEPPKYVILCNVCTLKYVSNNAYCIITYISVVTQLMRCQDYSELNSTVEISNCAACSAHGPVNNKQPAMIVKSWL